MVRLGQWQEALNVLTPLRQARYSTGTATALTASSQAEALKVVLEERRRELPFAFRLSDIKRFSVNETPDDDVTITRDFFEVSVTEVDTKHSQDVGHPRQQPCTGYAYLPDRNRLQPRHD